MAGRCRVTVRQLPPRTGRGPGILARMPDTAPAKPWIRRRTTQIGIVLLLLIVWSLAANQWIDKGCGTAQSYGLVVTHFGTPAANEGCESEPGGPQYTDHYDG